MCPINHKIADADQFEEQMSMKNIHLASMSKIPRILKMETRVNISWLTSDGSSSLICGMCFWDSS